jgi:hypothetical protein
MTRHLTLIALISLGPVLHAAASTVAGPPAPRGAIAEVFHENGTPCPDDGAAPCDRDCACPCCHGHSPTAARPLAPLVTAGPPACSHRIARPPDLHPIELVQQIFRPPRRPA